MFSKISATIFLVSAIVLIDLANTSWAAPTHFNSIVARGQSDDWSDMDSMYNKYTEPHDYPKNKCYIKIQRCCQYYTDCVNKPQGKYYPQKNPFDDQGVYDRKDEKYDERYDSVRGQMYGDNHKQDRYGNNKCLQTLCDPLVSKYPPYYEKPQQTKFVNYNEISSHKQYPCEGKDCHHDDY